MELLGLAIALLILGAAAAAFGSDSRPGFAGNREDVSPRDRDRGAARIQAAEATPAILRRTAGASTEAAATPKDVDDAAPDGTGPGPLPGLRRAA